jgi:hypothetical protein
VAGSSGGGGEGLAEFLRLLGNRRVPKGSIIMIYSASHLADVGVAAYAEHLVEASEQLNEKLGKETLVAPLPPVLLGGCTLHRPQSGEELLRADNVVGLLLKGGSRGTWRRAPYPPLPPSSTWALRARKIGRRGGSPCPAGTKAIRRGAVEEKTVGPCPAQSDLSLSQWKKS